MKTQISMIFVMVFILSIHFVCLAQEPYFCNPQVFLSKEIGAPFQNGIVNLHLFKVGNLTLAGMAVGKSSVEEVKNLARTYSAHSDTKFCTWYINEGNQEAEQSFNHKYTMNPQKMNPEEAANNFLYALTESFTTLYPSFWTCADNQHYVAIGCHGQQHRGPSGFGMFLTFAGCHPENAENIVDTLWGLNGVRREVRLAILWAGYNLGHQHPELRQKIQSQMLSQ